MKRIARHRGYSRGRELGVRNPSDLLCKVKEHAEKPSQFVAPSWSWAALNMGENCQVATTSVKFRCYKSKLFSDDWMCKECLIPSARRLFGRFVRGPCLAITDFGGLSPRSDCLPDIEAVSVDLVYVQILCFPTRQWFFPLRRQHLERNLCFGIEPIDGTTFMKGIVELVFLEIRLQIRARLGRLRQSTRVSLPLLVRATITTLVKV